MSWSSPEASWADSCLVDDGSGDGDGLFLRDDSGVRNSPPGWTPSPCEGDEEIRTPTVSPFRQAVDGKADDVFRPWDIADIDEDSVFILQLDGDEEPVNIFPIWDLNTESPSEGGDYVPELWASPLEQGGESLSEGGSDLNFMASPSVEAFDLQTLSSALEEEPDLETLIAGMADLSLSASRDRQSR